MPVGVPIVSVFPVMKSGGLGSLSHFLNIDSKSPPVRLFKYYFSQRRCDDITSFGELILFKIRLQYRYFWEA